jgi:hypothetical protein
MLSGRIVFAPCRQRRIKEMKTLFIAISCILLFAFGCGSDKSKPSDSGETKPSAGRPDTKAIEAASGVGYDGTAMRRSVDKALNQAEARKAEQQKALDEATKGK